MKPTPEQERIARAVVKISYLEAESENGSVVSELYIKIAQALADEAERAREEEREACAKVAEEGFIEHTDHDDKDDLYSCVHCIDNMEDKRGIATAIRRRGQTEKQDEQR